MGKLFVFGSILTDHFNEDSDVDEETLTTLKSWSMDLQMIIEHKICEERINYSICEKGN